MADTPDWAKESSVTVSPAPDWATSPDSRPGKSIAKRLGDPSFVQQMGGLAYGAGTQVLGAPGEAEEFLTTGGKSEKLGGEGQFFPTTKQVRTGLKEIGIEPPAKTGFMQKTGEVLADVGMAVPMGARTVGTMVGSTTKEGERIAGIAERLGFKLSPSQVRADSPVAEKGAVFNAKTINYLQTDWQAMVLVKLLMKLLKILLKKDLNPLEVSLTKYIKARLFLLILQ